MLRSTDLNFSGVGDTEESPFTAALSRTSSIHYNNLDYIRTWMNNGEKGDGKESVNYTE